MIGRAHVAESDAGRAAVVTRSHWPWRGLFIVMLLTLAAILPFVRKAYHIDDPTYLWTARQIIKDPLNFYGYTINWYWTEEPMHTAMKNPPLTAHYMAAASLAVGWSEAGQHAAFALWTVGLAAGVFVLARKWGVNPMLAALATIFTPGTLVSATNVMCDVMMVCLWVWSMVLWEHGLTGVRRRGLSLIGAAALIALAALTKYFAIALVPLLVVHAVMRLRRGGWWIAALVIPFVILAIYEFWARHLYGHGLILEATEYSSKFQKFGSLYEVMRHGAVGLAFAGGCAAVMLFCWPRLWPWWVTAGSCLMALALAVLSGPPTPVDVSNPASLAALPWILMIQAGVWVTVGVGVLLLPLAELWKRRDATAVTLTLWIWGTFVFATFVNWSVTARTILPMIPAVGIVIARRMQRGDSIDESEIVRMRTLIPLSLSTVLALVVTSADCSLANSARDAARSIARMWMTEGRTMWFQGHWGFQWYMQEAGARPIDQPGTILHVGDRLAIPYNNCNVHIPENVQLERLERLQLATAPCVTTMQDQNAAGFYSSVIGPLPFAFGRVPPEQYDVFEVGEGD